MTNEWHNYRISGEGTKRFYDMCAAKRTSNVWVERIRRDARICLATVLPGYGSGLNKNVVSTSYKIPTRTLAYLEKRFDISLEIQSSS